MSLETTLRTVSITGILASGMFTNQLSAQEMPLPKDFLKETRTFVGLNTRKAYTFSDLALQEPIPYTKIHIDEFKRNNSTMSWTDEDTAREAIFFSTLVVDWGQTLYASDNRHRYEENNPLLGKHPSRGAINRYFPVIMLAHTALARVLPNPYRKCFQVISIQAESGCISKNTYIDVKVRF